jgi:hypothetical protein
LGLNVETSCLAAAVDTRLTSGFLNVNFGTGEAYTVRRQVIRVRLGVCARQGNLNGDGTPLYSAQYVQQTGISSALIFNAYSDAACATVPPCANTHSSVSRKIRPVSRGGSAGLSSVTHPPSIWGYTEVLLVYRNCRGASTPPKTCAPRK